MPGPFIWDIVLGVFRGISFGALFGAPSGALTKGPKTRQDLTRGLAKDSKS